MSAPSSPTTACLDQLTKAYEEHCEAEQLATGKGENEKAVIEHGACIVILRAMVAEDIDPKPKGLA